MRFDAARTALLVIDMQRDFLLPQGYAAHAGLDIGPLRQAIDPVGRLLTIARAAHLTMQTHGHHIGGITIRVDDDRAGSECYVIARLRMASPNGALTDIVSHGRYVDRWERRADGVWRIAHRRYLHTMDERRTIEAASFPTTGSRDREDPSYDVLRGGR